MYKYRPHIISSIASIIVPRQLRRLVAYCRVGDWGSNLSTLLWPEICILRTISYLVKIMLNADGGPYISSDVQNRLPELGSNPKCILIPNSNPHVILRLPNSIPFDSHYHRSLSVVPKCFLFLYLSDLSD